MGGGGRFGRSERGEGREVWRGGKREARPGEGGVRVGGERGEGGSGEGTEMWKEEEVRKTAHVSSGRRRSSLPPTVGSSER